MSPRRDGTTARADSQESAEDEAAVDKRLLTLVIVATLLSLAHHADHVIRGNHVGWPVTGTVNVFTYSLAIYPVVALGVVRTLRGSVGSRYWFGVSTAGLGLLAVVHFGPLAVEPPADILGPYAPSPVGYLALAVLVALLLALSGLVVATVTRLSGD